MSKLFERAQQFGKSFMLPIAILPAAGLLLGIGGALSNPNTVKAYPVLDIGLLQNIFILMSSAGNIVFQNLPVIFAIGVAIGLAKSDKGTAGLAAMLGFLIMNASMNGLLTITGTLAKDNLAEAGQSMVLGIQTVETGVFGGIITGIMTALLHNKFHKISLPDYLGFFGGSRFVPIITAIASIVLGVIMFFVWPTVQGWIFGVGGIVDKTGIIGTFFFGFILRLLGPFGLHHIFYLPFWQTALGGSLEVKGHMIQGTQNIFFAQLGDSDVTKYFSGVSRYMSGRFITMMFGLCGAALAIYHTAKPERKKVVGGLMLSAALTSFLTGITEPLEFSFLFVAPLLYVIHAFLDGLAFMMADVFNITVGQTFSGGFIDFLLFGVLQGNSKTNFLWVIPIGIIWFIMYYFIFRFLITKFNFKTPGREDEVTTEAVEATDRAQTIIKALGGKENIDVVDCCATRLRVTLNTDKEVDKSMLSATQARGVIQKGNGVQVIYGPHVTTIKNEVEALLENETS
ncbi:glucose-specific PTS transporter subunit IIBC [Staphylococcus shinii]|jgi:PTS system maltose and glucose-specific IIC component|uniref:PTS glucose transporter subunit IIB n=1 Tax=Staphylococcus shinii TaxID=2912228 RepID=A0A418IIH7_9STAP|nr:glucose-specific PTS transporter subunit IIBC [Staphylococcus shinii]MDW8563326.1 glucose-specific PTS transporter subunit IIBC [Staphylococcus shinii]MDW8566563.1 glucose-specific PTS transporter subunit IIBC [Staphylococcus shinii]MDW8569484.1 glucose-specific PTS transporter subunit IIBC [Staphylococcus shinii]MDW8571935.1 glucose-specific PTS transporter subunit IIBC [Staphylococcus shinii]RIN02707.1 PTS glucose transporter subunit IIB [Staphylococcus shinii]